MLDLVPCPDCGGVSFFGDEACEGCRGRGCVPIDADECVCCERPAEPGGDEGEECLAAIPFAVEVPPGSVETYEHNPAIDVRLGVPANSPEVYVPWNEVIPF